MTDDRIPPSRSEEPRAADGDPQPPADPAGGPASGGPANGGAANGGAANGGGSGGGGSGTGSDAGERGGSGTGGGATAADGSAPTRPPLVRSDRHRVVAGVCGGLGRHLDIDPVVFRVVVAVLCLSGGLGLFLYGLAWLIVPAEESRKTEIQRVLTGQVDAQSIGAVLLTVIGTGVFFSWMDRGDHLFPLLLLGVLIFFALRYDPERRQQRSEGVRRGPRSTGPYDRHATDRDELRARREEWRAQWQEQRRQFRQEWAERREEMRHSRPSPTGYRWDPRHPERNPYGLHGLHDAATPPPATPPAWWQREDLPEGDPLRKPAQGASAAADEPPATGAGAPWPTPRPGPYHPPYQRERSFLGPVAFLLSLGAGAAVWAASGGERGNVRLTTVLAAVLLVQGLALVLAAHRGRVRGLVLPALLTTLALAAAGTSDVPLKASTGDRNWAPAEVSQVQPVYNLGAGNARLDLSRLDPAGAIVSTGVRLGAGDLAVTVPDDVRVQITVRSAAGDIELPDGSHNSGLGNEQRADLAPLRGTESKGTISLDLQVGLGDVRVVRQ
ncbi:PspC domain-containing protein [Peterkaempfera griseoplana]|uniref:PspC domain-containing protein n=1 Tax=Peterkaempfera griseoplana TaxID=66896 RepID=UPI0006E14714|nr:PspC domain-containing protein [Peterkaempfera griseoplana]